MHLTLAYITLALEVCAILALVLTPAFSWGKGTIYARGSTTQTTKGNVHLYDWPVKKGVIAAMILVPFAALVAVIVAVFQGMFELGGHPLVRAAAVLPALLLAGAIGALLGTTRVSPYGPSAGIALGSLALFVIAGVTSNVTPWTVY